MALNMVAGLVFIFVTIFQCTPVNHFWNRLDQDFGKCIDIGVLIDVAYLCSAVAALTDFIIGLLPAFIIWNLHMSRRNKIAAGMILSLGCMFVFPPCARTHCLWNKANINRIAEQVSPS